MHGSCRTVVYMLYCVSLGINGNCRTVACMVYFLTLRIHGSFRTVACMIYCITLRIHGSFRRVACMIYVVTIKVLVGFFKKTSGVRVAQWVRSLDLTTQTSLSPMPCGFAHGFVMYKKWCTRLAAASDNAYQFLTHGRWFSPASSTIQICSHNIAEILLKVAIKTKKINQSIIKNFGIETSHWVVYLVMLRNG